MKKNYDKILTRLIGILSKLSNDERYDTKEFAREYNVTVRTIQKDINERLLNFPIEKDSNGKFKFIDGFTLNKSMLNTDEMMLVSLALAQFYNVSDFDKLTDSALKKLLNPSTFNPFFIKQDDLEDIEINSNWINTLEEAIRYQNNIMIDTIEVEPYKITNFDGLWYLFAKDLRDEKIKTFMLKKIKKIELLNKKYILSAKQIDSILQNVNSAWFEDGQSFSVKIKVASDIAIFFKEKQFLQSQVITDELKDGSLVVSFEVTHDEDIDNMIKSWLPHIEVLEPKKFRKKIIDELKEYINKLQKETS